MNKSFRHALEFNALRCTEKLVNVLPRSVALMAGSCIGSLLYKTGVYGPIARKNLEYTGYTVESEREKILSSLYRNIGRYGADFLRVSSPLPPHRIENSDCFQPLFDRGKGVIAILGHLGNWELQANIFGTKMKEFGKLLNVVAKPMKNARVDAWLARKRAAASVTTIYTDKALRNIYEVLKNNGIVAILIDQWVGGQGTMVPFLGRDANTTRTVAGLANKTGCAVIISSAIMNKTGGYDITIDEVPSIDTKGMINEDAITALQHSHNDALSALIRKYPEHWFGWFHRRFKENIDYGKR